MKHSIVPSPPGASPAPGSSSGRLDRSHEPASRNRKGLAQALSLLFLVAVPAMADDCTVPGDHATVQEAIDDTGCSRILLASATFEESISIERSLEVVGQATGDSILTGPIAVSNSATVDVRDLRVTGCSGARLTVTGGARVNGDGLDVETPEAPPCFPLFYDGFESGDTNAWSATTP